MESVQQVQAALDDIRPVLQADGGDIELLEVSGGVARMRFTGMCATCPAQEATLMHQIQRAISLRSLNIVAVRA